MNPVRFGDKYILLDQIGAGGVAEVFRGKLTREQGFEKLIVIKKLLPEHNTDREMVDIFISEARLAALLQHENIAATYDFGELDDEYFLAMEYLFGKNLHLIMARARNHEHLLGPTHALAVCSRICEGMEYAHNLTDLQNKPLNLVHRDLTPHNIFITYDGKVKILDFGVAKAEMFDNKTREGVVKGKISYMSPERLTGEEVDARSDIFSIGILLYEMIGRTRMYQGDTAELIRKCLTAEFENLKEIAPDLDPRIYAILDKALAVDVTKRYETCAQMQTDIDDLLFDTQQRGDSKVLKDLIQQLFADDYEVEQYKVANLFTSYHEGDLLKHDKTDISIPRRPAGDEDADKTMVLAYQPAVQLLKSKTKELGGLARQAFEKSRSLGAEARDKSKSLIAGAGDKSRSLIDEAGDKSRSLIDKAEVDKRYIWGGAGVALGVVLLIALLMSGDDPPSETVTQKEPETKVTLEVIEVPTSADKNEVAESVIDVEEISDGNVAVPASSNGPYSSSEQMPQRTIVEQAPPPRSIPTNTAKVPVLKSRELKIKKQGTALPSPRGVQKPPGVVDPPPRVLAAIPAEPPVDVAGQTMSFEEEARDHSRKRKILMLHTRAEEAMQQGRLLEPVQHSANTYYRQILELDPEDNRARDGLRLIGDNYGALAETALAANQFDRAAGHVANGLEVTPGYPRLLAIDERIKRERADQIFDLTEKARLCLDAGKLSTPAKDSAYYYYNEVLRLDPENELVAEGYKKIADKYATLADHSFRAFDYDRAETYVRRGLQVVADHYYLLSLQQELQRGDLEKVGHSMKKRINKLFSD